jgi:hypothetical protein
MAGAEPGHPTSGGAGRFTGRTASFWRILMAPPCSRVLARGGPLWQEPAARHSPQGPILYFPGMCCRSSVVEHSLGKGEVDSSILSGSTRPSVTQLSECGRHTSQYGAGPHQCPRGGALRSIGLMMSAAGSSPRRPVLSSFDLDQGTDWSQSDTVAKATTWSS